MLPFRWKLDRGCEVITASQKFRVSKWQDEMLKCVVAFHPLVRDAEIRHEVKHSAQFEYRNPWPRPGTQGLDCVPELKEAA